MPARARTSIERIVQAAAGILEAEGPQGLTMRAVAAATGVRAPSLYKHVGSRAELIRLVASDAVAALADDLQAAASTGEPRRDLAAIARSYRAFAHARPEAYRLLFSAGSEEERIDPGLNVRASETVLRTTARLVGPDQALPAARTAVAWAHGFVSMELSDAFRLGGDVDEAFAYGIERIVAALAADGA